MRLPKTVLTLLVLVLSGCALPEWRVGQATVPEPITVSDAELEAYRQGADYVARTIEGPVETVYVADVLSSTMGAPERPQEDAEAVVELLRAVYRENQTLRRELNAALRELQGKKIEGTGIDLAPWGGGLGIVAIGMVLVFVPGALTVARIMVGRMRAIMGQVVEGVGEYFEEQATLPKNHPLGIALSRKLDTRGKALVRKLKAETP